jgi:hypothetical protein
MEIHEKKAEQADRLAQLLPLVVEIIPGQAGEGLIEVYEPGNYEDQSLQELCGRMLAKTNWSLGTCGGVPGAKRSQKPFFTCDSQVCCIISIRIES